MAAVREFYGLSAREAEVAELIARGNTVAHIAELLFVSENTVRTHSKREAGHPQTSRAHRPRRKLRTRRAIKAGSILNAVRSESRQTAGRVPLLSLQQLLHGATQGTGQAVEGYALGLVDVLLSLLV